MLHVDFKKWPCHPVKFKGQGPHYRNVWEMGGPVGSLSEPGLAGNVRRLPGFGLFRGGHNCSPCRT